MADEDYTYRGKQPPISDRRVVRLGQLARLRALDSHQVRPSDTWELLVFVAEELEERSQHFDKILHHIERMERHIMAADDQIAADFTQMANDVDELTAAVTSFQAQIQAGNQQGAIDEANKILTGLQPISDKLRAAAAQFDPTTPPVTPPDQPVDATRHGKHGK